MRVSAIAAMAANRVIGIQNTLPWKLPADLKRFKALTLGRPVIMGRKTFESIGRPLPGRQNIVITRQRGYNAAGVQVVGSIEEALRFCERRAEEIFIIGGAEIWKQAWPKIDRLYLTVIHRDFEGDAFFPEFDRNEFFEAEREDHEDVLPFSYFLLERKSRHETAKIGSSSDGACHSGERGGAGG